MMPTAAKKGQIKNTCSSNMPSSVQILTIIESIDSCISGFPLYTLLMTFSKILIAIFVLLGGIFCQR